VGYREMARRLRYLGSRRRFDEELEQEIRFHLETRAEELQREGLGEAEARARARREFGSTAIAGEEARSSWQFVWLEDLVADLRYALRAFRRNPSFAATAVFCLALGVGANTTMFSIAMEVLFSRPSCRDARSLVQVQVGGAGFCDMKRYRFLRDARLFDGLAGMNIGIVANWRSGEASYRLAGTRVTDNFFEVAGIPLAFGRGILRGERATAVLSDGFWRRKLAADPNVLGRVLVLDGSPYTVVGVLPPNHRTLIGFGFAPDLYLPTDSIECQLYARLPQGMSRQEAFAKAEAGARELDRVLPDAGRKWARGVALAGVDGLERLRQQSELAPVALTAAAFLAMLVMMTGLVLLIACANVSSLLLARAVSRARELAIRRALGGSRGRLVRQLLGETLLVAACGTAAGLALNIWLTRTLSTLPLPVPWIEFHIRPDWRLLAYSTAVSFVATLAAGLAPALKGSRGDLGETLKQPRRWTLRNALVAGQVAVSIVLLSAGLLFYRNLLRASALDLGFDSMHTVWASFRVAGVTPERFHSLADAALERLKALPAVETASFARMAPMTSIFVRNENLRPEGTAHPAQLEYNFNGVGPEYFRVMGIRILEGRAFQDSDRAGAAQVVILNEALAKRLFGAANPLGRTIRFADAREARVIGIARNSRYSILQNPLALYGSYAQDRGLPDFANFVVRARGNPEAAARAVSAALTDVDATASVTSRSMRDAVRFMLLPSQVAAGVLGLAALLGLTLASIGLYGVLLYAFSRRTPEIGIRMALGAGPASVVRLIAGESARLAGAGLALGLALSLAAVRPLSAFLVPEVRAVDPASFLLVALGLAVVAALATVSPAMRATRVDPALALKHE
jgi:predicted permease